MDPKTNKLLQQAGKYILLGKLTLALEEYVKISELEPEDTTIMNTIGDLHGRLGNKEEALQWYQKLAETFEYRELFPNAIATYRKILRISPKNQQALNRLAQLYERQGQVANAKLQYKVIAHQEMSLGNHDKAIETYRKICGFDSTCHESQLELGQFLEQLGRLEQACQSYLKCAKVLVQKGDVSSAGSVVANIFRLKPENREFLKEFFSLLQEMKMTDRGVEYLQSLSLDEDSEFKSILGEVFLREGNLEVAQKYMLPSLRNNPNLYPSALKLLQELIAKRDVNASLDLVDTIFEMSIQLHDEFTLKVMLDSLLQLDESSIRTLKTLTTLLIRMNDRHKLEDYLKRLVILQLREGNLREGRDSFNKMVVYGQSGAYLDLLNALNDAIVTGLPEVMQETSQKVIDALEKGPCEKEENSSGIGLALGVSELDLGIGIGMEMEMELEVEEGLLNETVR